jgi:hypothetical protein
MRRLLVKAVVMACLLAVSCTKKEAVIAPPVQRYNDFFPSEHSNVSLGEVDMFVSIRKRARQMRDDAITRGRSDGDFDLQAAQEQNENPEEVKWVRQQITETIDSKTTWSPRISRNFEVLARRRAELRSVGVVVPETLPRFMAQPRDD